MNKKLYVGNLDYSITGEQLSEIFGKFGTVVSADVIIHRDTGRSKGFGFVEMSTEEEAQEAIDKVNGTDLDGKNNGRGVVVNEARPPKERSF